MGIGASKVVEDEKTKWAVDHALNICPERQAVQHQDIASFASRLYMCWHECNNAGLKYKHFFVTDRTWTIEFLGTGVAVHQNSLPTPYHMEVSFEKTDEVTKRMSQVCGAVAYSVTLRNCEHLARYIYSGSWVSFQMLKGAFLGSTFVRHMMDEHKKKSNCLPCELLVQIPTKELYPQDVYAGFLRFTESPQGLSRADRDSYNVLVVGPSGAGKSRIINLLFNRYVAESMASPHSVTRQMKVLSGQGLIHKQCRKVNIIDTIGLCDSHMSAGIVLELVREHLQVNFAYVDQVVVVCSNRIENIHVENIKQFLAWLKYGKRKSKYNFTFIYNHADRLPSNSRDVAVLQMCESLGINMTGVLWKDGEVFAAADAIRPSHDVPSQMTIAKSFWSAFPSHSSYDDLKDDLFKVVDSIFTPPAEGFHRLPVEESWCSIL